MIIFLGHGYTAEWQQGDKFVTYRAADGVEYDWARILPMGYTPTFMDAWRTFYVRETGNY